jgi:hypothetical protein
VATPPTFDEMLAVISAHWTRFRSGFDMPMVTTAAPHRPRGIADYVAWVRSPPSDAAPATATDPVSTASTELDRDRR